MNPAIYESSYRRVAFALTSICVLVVALLAAVVAASSLIEDGNSSLQVILYSLGAMGILLVMILLSVYRVHRWTIEEKGVRIEERPKIPFAGLPRRAFIGFPDIAALRNVESGLDFLIEIAARDGRVFRLMEPRQPLGSGAGAPTPPSLKAFAAAISKAAAAAGFTPPAVTEGLSFWNRPAGLGVILVMLVFSLGFAAAAAWALFDGGLETHTRGGQMTVIVILLPLGAGYLFYKSLKRRRRVLSAQSNR